MCIHCDKITIFFTLNLKFHLLLKNVEIWILSFKSAVPVTRPFIWCHIFFYLLTLALTYVWKSKEIGISYFMFLFLVAWPFTHDGNIIYLVNNLLLTSTILWIFCIRDDFGFPIVNFPWLSGDVPRLPSYGIYISQLVRISRCCTSVFDFHSKNLQITSKLLKRFKFHLVENSEMPSTSTIWPRDHREDYRSCAWPFYSLVQIIP